MKILLICLIAQQTKLPEDTKDLLRHKVQSSIIHYGRNKFESTLSIRKLHPEIESEYDVNLIDPKTQAYKISLETGNTLFDFLGVYSLIWDLVRFDSCSKFLVSRNFEKEGVTLETYHQKIVLWLID